MHWLAQRAPGQGSVGVIRELNAQADAWREAELARARKRLAKGDDVEAVLDALSRGLTQKMLHGAMVGLNAEGERRTQTLDAVNQLFLRNKR
jgi:glutamyl-tRNA reductase